MGLYDDAMKIGAMKIWKLPDDKKDKLTDVCKSGEYFLQEKIDGAYYQIERTEEHTYMFSRSESKVSGELSEKGDRVPHIINAFSCLPPKTIIIGEVYFPGGTAKDTVTITGSLPAKAIEKQKDNPIHYYAHDIIFYDGINLMDTGAEDRYDILAAIWKKHGLDNYDFLRLATKVTENLEAEISRILYMGGEGAVLKKKDYPYVPGKRPAWSTIKVKQMDSIDLVCCGLIDATKEYTGKEIDTWPYWQSPEGELCHFVDAVPRDDLIRDGYTAITKYYYLGWKTAMKIGAYDDDGNLVELGTVASGLTEDMKRLMTEFPGNFIGHVVALDCMSIDKKEHTLRHPVFKCMRDDKPARDCVIKEIFA